MTTEDAYIRAVDRADEIRRRIVLLSETTSRLREVERLEDRLAVVEREIDCLQEIVLAERAAGREREHREGKHQPIGRLRGIRTNPRRKAFEEVSVRPAHRVRDF